MGSRKKHRNRENEFYGNNGGGANNPLGIDFSTLSSLFGNIDQNQLMSMMQMLGQNGINMDNVGGFEQNQMNGGNFFNSMGSNNSSGNISGNNMNKDYVLDEKEGELDTKILINKLMGNNLDLNFTEDERIYEELNKKKGIKKEEESIKDDPNIEMLLALRKIVSKERVRFIDKVIQLYINGEFGEF